MLRKGSSWLGGLVLAGLVLGCTAGTEMEEKPAVASEEAVDQEEEAGREAAVTGQDHVIYMLAVENPGEDWGCAVEPDTTVRIASGDTVTFSGDRLPDPAVVRTRVVVRPTPQKSNKPANTARPAIDPPYEVEKGKSASMGAVTGVPGDFWIWAADFHFREPNKPAQRPCVVDPVICVGSGLSGDDPGGLDDPCQ